MKKIAFHSYKGGVGRTKIMVGAAMELAMRGHRVGMIDFDVDASGLASSFNQTQLSSPDLLQILHRGDLSLLPSSTVDVTPLVANCFGRHPEGRGCLKYIPTISDAEIVDTAMRRMEDVGFIKDLFHAMGATCGIDLILIDVRPGISPQSSVIFPVVDHIVMVSRLDRQNIQGLKWLVPILRRKEIPLTLIANLVPDSEFAVERLSELQDKTGTDVHLRIDYEPDVVLDEDFAYLAREDSNFRIALKTLVDQIGVED